MTMTEYDAVRKRLAKRGWNRIDTPDMNQELWAHPELTVPTTPPRCIPFSLLHALRIDEGRMQRTVLWQATDGAVELKWPEQLTSGDVDEIELLFTRVLIQMRRQAKQWDGVETAETEHASGS